jgi:hypothetical protein
MSIFSKTRNNETKWAAAGSKWMKEIENTPVGPL